MGIVRSFEWRLCVPADAADQRLRAVCEEIGASPQGAPQTIKAKTRTSFLKNRWAADLNIDIASAPYGSLATILVEMVSPQHDLIIKDLSKRMGQDAFAKDPIVEEHEDAPGDQGAKIKRLQMQFGGSETDVWAVGQPGSGFLRFDGDTVHIQHSGALSRLTVGKGSKRIPVSQITAMHMKPAGPIVSGYLQFSIGGGVETRSQFGRASFDAAGDENTIMFTKDEQPYFERFRDAVEKAIAEHRRGPVPQVSAPDLVGQLKGIAELRDAGVLTEEEFQQKKADILRRM